MIPITRDVPSQKKKKVSQGLHVATQHKRLSTQASLNISVSQHKRLSTQASLNTSVSQHKRLSTQRLSTQRLSTQRVLGNSFITTPDHRPQSPPPITTQITNPITTPNAQCTTPNAPPPIITPNAQPPPPMHHP